ALGLRRENASRILNLDSRQLSAVVRATGGRYRPILHKDHIPEHPFGKRINAPQGIVPVMVGFTKDEMTLYNVGFDWWRQMDQAELARRAEDLYPGKSAKLLNALQKAWPDYAPRHLYTALLSTRQYLGATTLAERKAQQNSGDVYLYSFNWDAPVENGILKSPHAIELPFVFDNVEKGPLLLGRDKKTIKLGNTMAKVWTSFARTGNPNTRGIPSWAPYNTDTRMTMTFDERSKVISNYLGEVRPLLR
ncbi:MAG: carboxylesterase family protein, partial [Pseudomonadales bacterium]|nr:carboxylesterase family protein [Pseudomonadales bacterium]